MKIKKFTAASMQDAAKQIKKELGNDAVILHSKQVKKRKWLGPRSQEAVEVIAVLDRDVREARKTPPSAAEEMKKTETAEKAEPVQPPRLPDQSISGELAHYKEVLPEPLKKPRDY